MSIDIAFFWSRIFQKSWSVVNINFRIRRKNPVANHFNHDHVTDRLKIDIRRQKAPPTGGCVDLDKMAALMSVLCRNVRSLSAFGRSSTGDYYFVLISNNVCNNLTILYNDGGCSMRVRISLKIRRIHSPTCVNSDCLHSEIQQKAAIGHRLWANMMNLSKNYFQS